VQQAFLVCHSPDGEKRRIAVGSSLTVGRAVDCGCVIDDAAASRRHVLITLDKGQYVWKDLGSTNGTSFNGEEHPGGVLRHGDRLQIGETALEFGIEDRLAETETPGSTTLIRESMLNWRQTGEGSPKEDRPERLLRAVYTVMSEIASNYEPCPLVDRILETTMKAIDAQRGAIVFAREVPDDLGPCPVCNRYHVIENGQHHHVEEREFHISSTAAHRVLRRGESLFVQDMDSPGDFHVSDSMVSMHLRSIMCAPLRGKYGILGILYVDSDRPHHQYTHDDMLLTTAVANSAGLALENARMHSQIIEKHRMDQEIAHAWAIQEGFLVRQWPEDDTRFTVFGDTRPAKVVGGDFYDYVRPDPGSVGILIGDVSGKGVPAALTMAQLLAEFRLCAKGNASPTAVLATLNEGLVARSRFGTFCTLCYLILNLDSGAVRCANAGHHPVIAAGKRGVRVLGSATGPPAGIVEQGKWTDVEFTLKQGESALLYTDGIVEARRSIQTGVDEAVEEFGMENLCRNVHESVRATPHEMVSRITGAVLDWCAPAAPHDDCTMIALKYVG
jgi:serine phosphatase RsbU (regulator of sigma subunit)